jgi:hypothetical protein
MIMLERVASCRAKFLLTNAFSDDKSTTQVDCNSLPALYAPINTFHHSRVLDNPNAQTGGSPNTDTLYSTAWLEIGEDPIVLSVQAVTDRY